MVIHRIRGPASGLATAPEVTMYSGRRFTPQECDFLDRGCGADLRRVEGGEHTAARSERRFVRPTGRRSHWLIEDPATHALNRRLASLSGTDVDARRAATYSSLPARPGISTAYRLARRRTIHAFSPHSCTSTTNMRAARPSSSKPGSGSVAGRATCSSFEASPAMAAWMRYPSMPDSRSQAEENILQAAGSARENMWRSSTLRSAD